MGSEWGVYWPNWWRLWPSWVVFPADEYGPAELVISFGPIQARKYLWGRTNG